MSAKAFYEREYDLLWDVIDKPEEGDHPDWVWVYRAAASAMIGPGDPHRKEVEEHFSSAGGDLYHQCGRYLVGKLSEKELLALPKTASDRCAVSFYIAVKAHGEGRYDDASDWYRVALETGADHEGGYNHTINILTRWSTTGQGLWLAKQQKL